jgi:hypothetical protein
MDGQKLYESHKVLAGRILLVTIEWGVFAALLLWGDWQ